MAPSRSFQESTKLLAPSSCNSLASAATSMPARANARQHLLRIVAVPAHRAIDLAVIGERQQRLLRHGVDRVRRGQRAHVEHVRCLRILVAGAGEQQPLRPRALALQPLPPVGLQQIAIRLVGLLRDRDAEPVAQFAGHLVHRRLVPAADEQRRDRAHVRAQPGRDPALQPAHVGIRRPQIVIAREQQRDVHRHAGEDRLLDGGKTLERARYLDEQVRPVGLRMQRLAPRPRSLPCRAPAAATPRARRTRPPRRSAGRSARTDPRP